MRTNIINILTFVFFITTLTPLSAQEDILCDTIPELRIAMSFHDKKQFDSSGVYFSKALKIYEAKEDWSGVLYSSFYLGRSQYMSLKYEEAKMTMLATNRILDNHFSDNYYWASKIFMRTGYSYHNLSNYDKSVEYYEKVLMLSEKVTPKHRFDLYTYSQISIIYREKGEYNLAEKSCKQGIHTWNKLVGEKQRKDSLNLLKIFNEFAAIKIYSGDYNSLDTLLESSIRLLNRMNLGENFETGSLYLNQGIAQFMLEKHEKAQRSITKAISILEKTVGYEHPQVANCLEVQASIYRVLQDYEKSEQTYHRLINMTKKILNEKHHNLIANYYNFAFLKSEMGKYDEALQLLNEAVELTLLNFDDKHPHLSELYNGLANVYLNKKDYLKTKKYLNKSLKIARHSGNYDIPQLAGIANAKARIQFDEGFYKEALSELEKAKKYYAQVFEEKHHYFTECYSKETEIYLQQNQYEQAIKSVNQAINSMLTTGSEIDGDKLPDIDKSISPFYLKDAIELKGDYYQQIYNQTKEQEQLRLALAHYHEAIEIINKNRISRRSESSKLKLSEDANFLLKKALPIAHQLFEITGEEQFKNRVFEYSEYNKALVLLSALNKLKAEQLSDMPDSLVSNEKRLKRQIAHTKKDIHYEFAQGDDADQSLIDSLRNVVFDLSEEHSELIQYIEQNYPDYYNLKYNIEIASVEDIQQNIDTNQTFLEYFMADTSIYIIIIDKDRFEIEQLEIAPDFTNTVDSMLYQIKAKSFEGYTTYAHQLYQILIAPVKDQITNERLIIIPDGILNLLPFDLLLIKPANPGASNYASLHYLLTDHPITYNYSATLYKKSLQNRNYKNKRSFLGMAPKFKGEELSEISKKMRLRSFLIPLPGAEDEVQLIGKLMAGDILLGNKATEKNFKDKAFNYKLLHLATHAILDDSDPLYSKLILPTDSTSKEDGFLHVYELYNMKMEADLMVLSACNTGVGEVKSGEGVMTLSRGISYAGCDNVMMTLWPVVDRSTSRLMDRIYKQLNEELPKDVALQRAKLDFLTTGGRFSSAPMFWGGVIFIGNPAPIQANTSFFLWGIGFILIVFIGILGIYRWRNRKTIT